MNTPFALSGVVIRELYRRKDFYVLFVLTAVITLVMASANFFNCLLLIWLSALVIGVTTAARQIPSERESRTIFPLLAKPVTRWDVVLGKFFGCWFAVGIALLVFYVFLALVGAAREHTLPVFQYFQTLWLHWMMLAIVIAMALLGSVVFAAPSSSSTICFVIVIAILLVGRHLNKLALNLAEPLSSIVYTLYYLIPQLEFFDLRVRLVQSKELIPWWACAAISVYAAAYTLLFLVITWLLFRRKPLN
jgi:ABC-type transport system involved in multi-copper enzyme maturation permease subunit